MGIPLFWRKPKPSADTGYRSVEARMAELGCDVADDMLSRGLIEKTDEGRTEVTDKGRARTAAMWDALSDNERLFVLIGFMTIIRLGRSE